MSFKQIVLTGLVAAVAANPVPSVPEVLTKALNEQLTASVGLDPVTYGLGIDETGTYVGRQTTFKGGCEKAKKVRAQAATCMLYKLDEDNLNQVLAVEGNPYGIHGTVRSGDNTFDLEDESQLQDLLWYRIAPMRIDTDENEFILSIGSDTHGSEPIILDNKVYLDSTFAKDTSLGRVAVFHFAPKKFNEELSLLCGYAAVPTCL
eukprot:Clim_evm74s33 gene=Clim_evmTU74s33